MRLLRASILAVLSLTAVFDTLANSTIGPVCSTKPPPGDLGKAQRAAFDDFIFLLTLSRNPQAAFDKYVPGVFSKSRQYIQHNPNALSGRENALNFLVPAWKDPAWSLYVLRQFVDKGHGITTSRASVNGTVISAVMDIFRFEGTCIVEHWDVVQAVTGNETNPIAFF
ncbi:hypothetical protein EST38_g1497 [Candolleomyces aberdarensis]|uniref:SnoaL-like domain-containing protein n=1 Tax=Candolleomyces aberdarensis TaxID=2316362 RepID=A0A4Q2DVR6_9AGAR|nr:hypothetical protein EST38_g1497 [Candolleomyces aberdarensis]